MNKIKIFGIVFLLSISLMGCGNNEENKYKNEELYEITSSSKEISTSSSNIEESSTSKEEIEENTNLGKIINLIEDSPIDFANKYTFSNEDNFITIKKDEEIVFKSTIKNDKLLIDNCYSYEKQNNKYLIISYVKDNEKKITIYSYQNNSFEETDTIEGTIGYYGIDETIFFNIESNPIKEYKDFIGKKIYEIKNGKFIELNSSSFMLKEFFYNEEGNLVYFMLTDKDDIQYTPFSYDDKENIITLRYNDNKFININLNKESIEDMFDFELKIYEDTNEEETNTPIEDTKDNNQDIEVDNTIEETPNEDTTEDNEVELVDLIYVYEKEGFGGTFSLTLHSNNTFSYYEGSLSSYYGEGTFELNEEEKTLTLYDNDKKFVFKVNDNYDLEFIEDVSNDFTYIDVSDGEKFYQLK